MLTKPLFQLREGFWFGLLHPAIGRWRGTKKRLVHGCELVAIEGESCRLKEAKARAGFKAAQRRLARPKSDRS